MENSINTDLAKSIGIPIISEKRRYWLVRTDGGQFRDEFIDQNFIGINWNKFNDLQSIKKCESNKEHRAEMREKLGSLLYNLSNKNSGRILGQIIRFVCDMQKDDIVIIPTANSTQITFGIIDSDAYLEDFNQSKTCESTKEKKCDYVKRRKVTWIKTINRETIDPLLYKMFNAHQAISCCDKYDMQIDRILEPLYYKNENFYFTINIGQSDNINGYDMFVLQKLVYEDLKLDRNNVSIKVNIQSQGILQWISDNIFSILSIFTMLNVMIGGGKATCSWGEIEMPGLLSWLIKNKELSSNKEIELQKLELDKMKIIQNSEEMNQINQSIEEYRETIERLRVTISESTSNANHNDDQE